MMQWRKLVKIAIVLAITSAAASHGAEQFPARPIRLVVGFAPGGGNDLIARMLGKYLTEAMEKTVVVDNRPGASGMIGTELVAAAPPDGYTLILQDTAHLINRFVFANAKYDPIADFTPISLVGTAPMVLVVDAKSSYANVAEFIAAARQQSGKLTMGSGGIGTITHLTGELFQYRTSVKLNHVPYKGAGPALADVAGGQIHAIFSVAAPAVPLVHARRVKALAVSSAKRSAAIPDVPTFEEAGVNDFRVLNWYGVFGPARIPRVVTARLNSEIRAALRSPSVSGQLEKLLVDPVSSSPEEFLAFLKGEAARWSQLIRAANIKAD